MIPIIHGFQVFHQEKNNGFGYSGNERCENTLIPEVFFYSNFVRGRVLGWFVQIV
jgi:hypothetical protein